VFGLEIGGRLVLEALDDCLLAGALAVFVGSVSGLGPRTLVAARLGYRGERMPAIAEILHRYVRATYQQENAAGHTGGRYDVKQITAIMS
jgi:hypothetical protein